MGMILLNAKAHGQDAATPVTAANSGVLGTQWSAATLVSPGAITFEGTDVIRFTDEGGSSVARADWVAALSGTATFSLEVELAACPAPVGGEMRIASVRNVADSADLVRVQVLADRTVRIYDGNGTSKWTSTTALPTAAGSRVYVGGTLTGGSAGEVTAAIYTASDGRSATAAESSGTLTGFGFGGATNIGGARLGCITTASTQTLDVRNFRLSDSQATALGPLGGVVIKGTMAATAAAPSPSATAGRSVTGGGPMPATANMLAPTVSAGGTSSGGGSGSLAITATLAGATTQPRTVLIDVTGLTVGAQYTITATAGAWSRTVTGGAGTASSTQVVLTDVATPLNTPVTYTVTHGGTTLAADPVTVPYAAGRAVLCSLDGRTVAPVELAHYGGDVKSQTPRVAVFSVAGRSRPVVHYDVALDETGVLPVRTSGTGTTRLRDLIRAGAPVLLRTDVGIRDLDPVEFLTITSATRTLLGASSTRQWDLGYVLVEDTAAGPVVQASLADINTVWAGLTLGDVNDAWAGQTLADLNAYDWVGEASS